MRSVLNTYNRITYLAIVIIAAFAMMTSCTDRAAHADDLIVRIPPAPYVAPYVPIGGCLVPYHLNGDQQRLFTCALPTPGGLDPARVSVLSSVATGSQSVSTWTVFAGEFGAPSTTIIVNFMLSNTASTPKAGESTVTVAVAQTTTSAAVTADVE
jgi:hypothetical protein